METKSVAWLSGWKLILVVYLSLLSLSHIVRTLLPEASIPADKKTVELQTVFGDSLTGGDVTMAYLDLYKGTESNPKIILTLHGSPQGNAFYNEFLDSLSQHFRIIAPDYVGYSSSDKEVEDYSIKAQAAYVHQLLDKIGVEQVHQLGFSLGGGVALELYTQAPEKITSTTMIAAIGVQELELLGGYHLNHGIHGAQLVGLWLIHEAIPHFGLLDDSVLSVFYARSFYDSDQRPLREVLTEYEAPMLIIHGEDDVQVPLTAAREHYRIVPHSEILELDGGHNIVQTHISEITEEIYGFIEGINSNPISYSKISAEETRIEAALEPYIPSDEAMLKGWPLIIVMVMIILATLVTEDLTCIGAGLMIARGIIGHFPAILACLLGIFIGDILIYFLGRWLGRSAIRRKPFKWFINEHDLDRSYQWFELKGPVIIIASRFVPGSRFPTYFAAGAIGASFFMFIIYFGIASLLWTPLLVELAVLVGNEMIAYFNVYQEYALSVLFLILFLFWVLFKIIIPSFTFRGRRLLYAKYKRVVNWEFWPPYILYLPVFFYVLFLAIKHRSLTVFTAANPGIDDGGFKNESKSAILKELESSGKVATYELIQGELDLHHKIDQVHDFLDRNNFKFPVVVKPDKGERGKQVSIVKDELLLEKILKYQNDDVIIQEYVQGVEFGVFYYRYPKSESGYIYSITEKRMMQLTGDGKHTLEHLILKDERAVCLAEQHIDHHADHIFNKPEDGEVVKLVEIGTHAKGSIFYDGMKYKTSELESAIDQIAKEFDGFLFGRFDIRVPSKEDFKKGENLTVIELNGVTSEATHIYNPGYTIWNAWKVLMRQWEIVFDIGAKNAALGARYVSLNTLFSRLVKS